MGTKENATLYAQRPSRRQRAEAVIEKAALQILASRSTDPLVRAYCYSEIIACERVICEHG